MAQRDESLKRLLEGNWRRNSSAMTPSMARRWRPKLWGEEYSSG